MFMIFRSMQEGYIFCIDSYDLSIFKKFAIAIIHYHADSVVAQKTLIAQLWSYLTTHNYCWY